MILYFDTYITDTPLMKKCPPRDDVRSKHSCYLMPKKIDIVKYSLASYSIYPWSHVYIKYEIEGGVGIAEMDEYIKGLFPDAIIEHERSDSQEDYKRSIKILEPMGDPWIFYAPNNDHPMIVSEYSDIDYIDRLIKKAETWRSRFPFVAIAYSHFSEYVNAAVEGSANRKYFGLGSIFLEEDNDAIIFLRPRGDFNAIQIVHIDQFRHWFSSSEMTGRLVRRTEDLINVKIENQIIVAPKKQLCAHFDGYEHMEGTINEILPDTVPPLFIPLGFFENSINISYGYKEYHKGWLNINPAASRYCFRDDKYGTDLKISLSQIQIFWKGRIKSIDINPQCDMEKLNEAAIKNFDRIRDPWSIQNRGLNFRNFIFQLRLHSRPFLLKLGIYGFAKKLFDEYKKHNFIF